MTYDQELTFELRLRGRSEDEIAETLRELRAHSHDPGAVYEEFGTPAEYAKGFEKRKRRTLGTRITAGATIAAILWVASWIATGLIRKNALDIDPALDGVIDTWVISGAAVAIVFAGMLAGYLVDRLRPVRPSR